MVKLFVCANCFIEPLRKLSTYTASPLFDLAIRLYVSWIFFSIGTIKFGAYLNGDITQAGSELAGNIPFDLFVPNMDASLATHICMFTALILPVFLAIGLFARFAAAGLLIMMAVVFYNNPDINVFGAVLMLVMTGSLFLKGPGFFSMDHLVVSALRARSAVMPGFKAQIGLEDVDTDLPGHEASGRFMRALATGFWYTIIGMGIVHFIGAVLTLIPGVDLTPAMVTNMFSRATPDTALVGYILAIIYAYVLGVIYAVTSQKLDVVYTIKKSVLWALLSGVVFMLLHYILI